MRCPACGHALLTIDLLQIRQLQAAAPVPGPRVDAPLLLRIPEAARLLQVSQSKMYQQVASGDVPVVRVGQSVRVARVELERLAGTPATPGED